NGATSSIGTFNGGNIALGNSTTLSVSSGTSSGVISGGGSLNKTGAGALQLLGINSYTGGTTISEGTLAVNGSLAGNVTVNTEAILQGAGSIGGALSVSGQLAPGNSIESIGAASVSFLSGSTYAYEFESASLNGDLLYTLGELNITTGTLLSLTDLSSGVLAANSKLTLISYGSRSGGLFTYNGNTLTDGSKFTIGQNEWLFRYDDTVAGSNFSGDQTGATQYVTMTVIPEPSVAMMAGSLAMMALLRRRRD
ncbi:MAG: autotransporter-associated beta strand repeat-containing protein, partial [Verrucomicrobiota bacterium]